MPGRLHDKVALVTGAGCVGPGWGNGRATAVLFAREGAKVLCADRSLASAEATVAVAAGGMLAPWCERESAEQGGSKRAMAHEKSPMVWNPSMSVRRRNCRMDRGTG